MNCILNNFKTGFGFGFAHHFMGGLLAPFMPNFSFFNQYSNPYSSYMGSCFNFVPQRKNYFPTEFLKFDNLSYQQSIWNTSFNQQAIFNTGLSTSFDSMQLSYNNGISNSLLDFYNDLGFGSILSSKGNSKTKKPKDKAKTADQDFDKMLDFVLKAEGGYVANDCGQAVNKGIQQNTYDSYRKRKGLAKKDVKNITDAEVRDIYYNDFYKASGADKINNKRLALYVFDTAVNMGVSRAKDFLEQCNGDVEKFEQLRRNKYEEIAQKPEKAKYLQGWLNRVDNVDSFATENFAVA